MLQLWSQPLPAGAPHRVGDINSLLANWTPDGSHIVFPSYEMSPELMSSINVANKDGSDPHPLAKVPGLVFAIRFSPDRRSIRFDIEEPFTNVDSLWEMDVTGKNIHPLFPDWKASSFQHCCGNWSPDGDYYYFQTGKGADQAIWVLPEHRSFFTRRAKAPSRLLSGPLRFSSPTPAAMARRYFLRAKNRAWNC